MKIDPISEIFTPRVIEALKSLPSPTEPQRVRLFILDETTRPPVVPTHELDALKDAMQR